MTYTIKQLDDAIEGDSNPWGDSWIEFRDELETGVEYVKAGADANPEDVDAGGYLLKPAVAGRGYRYHVTRPKARPGAALPNIGWVTIVDYFGGEGEGDQYWFVFQVEDADGTRLFRRNGWYQSYDGGHYDGPTEEVKPVEKTITVFEAI